MAIPLSIAVPRTPVALVVRQPMAVAPAAGATARPQPTHLMSGTLLAQRPSFTKPAATQSPPIMAEVVQSRVLLQQLQTVREQSQPPAATSPSMEVPFRYCLVTARRP
jgi:hypothetical protein